MRRYLSLCLLILATPVIAQTQTRYVTPVLQNNNPRDGLTTQSAFLLDEGINWLMNGSGIRDASGELTTNIELRLLNGTYSIDSPIIITPEHGGNATYEVVIEAYSTGYGANVMISGGIPLSGGTWGTGGGTTPSGAKWWGYYNYPNKITELYHNAQRLTPAREPDVPDGTSAPIVTSVWDPDNESEYTLGSLPGSAFNTTYLDRDEIRLTAYRLWTAPMQTAAQTIVGAPGSDEATFRFSHVDPWGVVATKSGNKFWTVRGEMHNPSGSIPGSGGPPKCGPYMMGGPIPTPIPATSLDNAFDRAFAEGHFGFMDEPHEWWQRNLAYGQQLNVLLPVVGSAECIQPTYNSTEWIVPRAGLENLLILQGSLGDPVTNVAIRHISFAYTSFDWSSDGLGTGYQTSAKNQRVDHCRSGSMELEKGPSLPAAIEFQYVEGCALKRCRVGHTGASALGIMGSNVNVYGNEFFDTGGTAVYAGRFNSDVADDVSTNIDIRGNLIHRFGQRFLDSCGIYLARCQNSTVVFNEIAHGSFCGIHSGEFFERPCKTPGEFGDCDEYHITQEEYDRRRDFGVWIRYNHIHNVMTQVRDNGAIYVRGDHSTPTCPIGMPLACTSGRVSKIEGNYITNIMNESGYRPIEHPADPGTLSEPSIAPVVGIYLDQGTIGFEILNNVMELIHEDDFPPYFYVQGSVEPTVKWFCDPDLAAMSPCMDGTWHFDWGYNYVNLPDVFPVHPQIGETYGTRESPPSLMPPIPNKIPGVRSIEGYQSVVSGFKCKTGPLSSDVPDDLSYLYVPLRTIPVKFHPLCDSPLTGLGQACQ